MRTHRPALVVYVAFMIGILIGSLLVLSWKIVLSGVAGMSLCAWIFRPKWISSLFLFCVVVGCGMLACQASLFLPQDHVSRIYLKLPRQEIGVQGVVVSPVTVKTVGRSFRTAFTLRVEALSVSGRKIPVSGLILINVFDRLQVSYGDEVMIRGKIHRPFEFGKRGRLSYQDFLKRRRVLVMMSLKKGARIKVLAQRRASCLTSFALELRGYLNNVFDRYLSPAESGLMKALVTGDRSALPEHVREIFLRTGTVHIIAISGLNIGMIAFGVYLLLSVFPVGRTGRMLLTIPILIFYTVMAGSDPPVVRSTIMTIVFLCSFMIEREQDAVNTLALSALIILGWDPGQLFDVGFQLSFVAVLAIILLTPFFLMAFSWTGLNVWGRGGRFVAESLAVSCAAFVGVTPLVVYYFYLLTPVSIMANLPVVPLVGIVTALGALLGAVGAVPWLAWPVAWCLKAALNLMVAVLYGCASIPGGSWVLPALSAWVVIGSYVILLGAWGVGSVFLRTRVSMAEAWKIGL